jgi:hypothetical protein
MPVLLAGTSFTWERTTVRLVDELSWLNSIVFSLGSTATASTVRR